jgi:hypothetical protein
MFAFLIIESKECVGGTAGQTAELECIRDSWMGLTNSTWSRIHLAVL